MKSNYSKKKVNFRQLVKKSHSYVILYYYI